MSHHTENNHVHLDFNHTEFSSSLDNGATRPTRAQQNEVQRHGVQRHEANQNQTAPALPAGQWLRAVLGFEAPFGHDGLPTVWG